MVYKSSTITSAGGGSVTQINTGTGLTGGPITSSGTISIEDKDPNTLAGFDNTGEFAQVDVGTGLDLSGGILSATGTAPSFTDITSGTNTTATMVVGTGASLGVSGSGTVTATAVVAVDAGGDTTTFPLLAGAATGSTGPLTDAGLTYNATTNALTTTTFVGALTGNASTATALQNARTIGGVSFDGTANIVPTTIVVADTTDSTCFVGLWESATGDLLPKTDAALTYNASTGALAATTFNGVALTTGGSATDFLNAAGNYVAGGSGSSAFDDITSGTNTTAAMVVGTGASLDVSGSGTINATSVVAVDAGGDTTTFPLLAGAATGSTNPLTDAGLTYNATTNALTTTTFIGALTGNATTATTATNVTVANEATDTTCFPLFVTAATGDLPPKTNTNLAYNSNTGAVTITSASATAFVVGPNGGTNPALTIKCDTASADCGLTLTTGTNTTTLDASGGDTNIALTLTSKGNSNFNLVTGSGGQLLLSPAGTARYTCNTAFHSFSTTAGSTASIVRFEYTGSGNTGLTGGTEFTQGHINMAQTNQHNSNTAITTNRDFRISGMNHSYASSGGVITNVGAFSVAWGNAGTNATITHNAAIYIPTQAITGTVTNAYAIRVAAPSGATNNFCASLTGTVALDGELIIDGTPTTDDTGNGPCTDTFNAGATISQWDLVYYGTGGEWVLADADAASTSGPVLLGLAMAAGTDNNAMKVALRGIFLRNDAWNWTVGAALYVSATAGSITETAPSTSGQIVRVVGYAMTADIVYFDPSVAWVEVP